MSFNKWPKRSAEKNYFMGFKRSAVLELACTHGSSEASRLLYVHALRTTPQIACRIGVAAARSVYYLLRFVSRYLVELAIDKDDICSPNAHL